MSDFMYIAPNPNVGAENVVNFVSTLPPRHDCPVCIVYRGSSERECLLAYFYLAAKSFNYREIHFTFQAFLTNETYIFPTTNS